MPLRIAASLRRLSMPPSSSLWRKSRFTATLLCTSEDDDDDDEKGSRRAVDGAKRASVTCP